jgi:hypothetical protein
MIRCGSYFLPCVSKKLKSLSFSLTCDKHDMELTTKGPITKGNLMLEALCSLMKFSISEMILFLMNSREKKSGVRKTCNQ